MASTKFHSPTVILVVEDDLGDQILIQEALQASQFSKQIQLANDGEEALEYLRRSTFYDSRNETPRPDLILLDLNMPRLGGKEVLARLKTDPAFKSIPIVAFTTSCREEDVVLCYSMGANSFVQKPTDFDQFQAAIRHLEHYWLQVSLFPPRAE